jgi:hypothetical protein
MHEREGKGEAFRERVGDRSKRSVSSACRSKNAEIRKKSSRRGGASRLHGPPRQRKGEGIRERIGRCIDRERSDPGRLTVAVVGRFAAQESFRIESRTTASYLGIQIIRASER